MLVLVRGGVAGGRQMGGLVGVLEGAENLGCLGPVGSSLRERLHGCVCFLGVLCRGSCF